MIPPAEQWAIQIDVTNACTRACSNCTRFVGHHRKPFFMDVRQFRQACEALADFPSQSPPTDRVRHKVVGMIGGEPLIHSKFAELCRVMAEVIPDRNHRGLWTGLKWQSTRHAALIEATFGYVNNNTHDRECRHSPILVALADVVLDPERRQAMIDDCWLERLWSGSVTPKGFFFCEVAAAFDMLMDGPGGLPVEPGCWRRPLADFREQIDRWCPRCGVPLNLLGRLDKDETDDISEMNLSVLTDSPRVKAGRCVAWDGSTAVSDAEPWRYIR